MHRLIIPLLLALAQPLAARELSADSVSPAQMQTGSLLLKLNSGYTVATRVNTAVDARVTGIVARVSVRQEFRNDGAEWVEGIYVFPLPDEAAVDHLRMYIGERFIEGEIREKVQAKKDYEAARTAGQKASLVEQHRANLFSSLVANIAPGESVVIEIEYLDTVRYDEGSFSLRIPLTITPRYMPEQQPAGSPTFGLATLAVRQSDASLLAPPMVAHSTDHMLTFIADLNAGVPLQSVSSRYHEIDVLDIGNRYQIGLTDGQVPMNHDLELSWQPVPAGVPRATLFTEELDGEPHALLMVLPPDGLLAPLQALPRELIFVVDTSGSMHGSSLAQAKHALALALGGLSAGDRFNLIQFNSSTNALFPGSVAATPAYLGAAMRYVNELSANGGTNMRPAIDRALSAAHAGSYLRQVIFVTDGGVGNEEELFNLIDRHLGNARLFTVGIGSAPNGWFMRKAAEAGRGTATMIGDVDEVKEKMSRLFHKLEEPQLTDISVEWPSGVTAESYPQKIPDLYAGQPLVLRAKIALEPHGGDRVVIRGNSALGTWEKQLPWNVGEPRSGVATLWARAKIGDLLDRLRRGAAEDQVRPAVIETALRHHLVSKYTSLVAIDKTPARSTGEMLAREQLPNRLPAGQSQGTINVFPATATGAGMQRLNGALLIAIALLLTGFLHAGDRGRATPWS